MTPTPEQERVREGAGYTPGEWVATVARWMPDSPAFGFVVKVDGRDHPIASDGVYLHTNNSAHFTPAELEANARLIAAAPELLEALEGLVAIIEAAGLYQLSRGVELGAMSWGVKCSDRLDAARTAIRKARGETA